MLNSIVRALIATTALEGVFGHDLKSALPPCTVNSSVPKGFKRDRRHTPSPTVACAHHSWLLSRGSCRAHPRRPVLRVPSWSLISAGGVVLFAMAKAGMWQLLESNGEEGKEVGAGAPAAAEENVKGAMITFIKAYKKELSPLMPPACRFLPTCSVYAVEAIEKFGPTKGAVLTAWRLMRCNPFAGYGTDNPRWPPPGWFAGERW